MAKYAILGHMAYFIWACHMWHVGCPGTQWDVPNQPVKTRPKLHCQNMSYGGYTSEVNLPYISKEQKWPWGQKLLICYKLVKIQKQDQFWNQQAQRNTKMGGSQFSDGYGIIAVLDSAVQCSAAPPSRWRRPPGGSRSPLGPRTSPAPRTGTPG